MASAQLRGKTWNARYKDGTGKWRSVPTKATCREEALRIALELEGSDIKNGKDLRARSSTLPSNASNALAMVAKGPEVPSEPQGDLVTLADLMHWWLKEFIDGGRSAQPTQSRTTHHITKQPIGKTPLREVTPQILERWMHSKKDTSGAPTLNYLRISISVAFNKALEMGVLPAGVIDNPAKRVKKRKHIKKVNNDNWLREDEVAPMLANIDPEYRNLAAVAVFTGSRKGEMCSLQRTDVDLDRMTITFKRSWEWDSTKGGKDRTVPIIPDLEPFIREQMKLTEGGFLLFPAWDGEMLRQDLKLQKFLRDALAKAGIDHPKMRWHDLRHTTGSILINKGVPLHVVQKVLGHASVDITEKVYSHLLGSTIRDEMVRGFAGAKAS